jgi:hypothetical protein
VQQRHWSACEEFAQVDQGKDDHGWADLCELDGDARLAATQDAGSALARRILRASRSPGHTVSPPRGGVYVSALTYCTTMTTCPSGLSVTVYQMVKPSDGRWRR